MELTATARTARRSAWAVLLACMALAAPAAPARAQFYDKVDLGKAADDALVSAFDGSLPPARIGSNVAGLASCGDPGVERLFRAMAGGSNPAPRVYGVLGAALVSGKGLDPALMSGLGPDERAAVVREANITGILKASPVDAILAQGGLTDAAKLSLIGEQARRGEAWDAGALRTLAASADPVAAGFSSLLLAAGGGSAAPDRTAWDAFGARLAGLPADERGAALRAIVEASMMFEVRAAVPLLLAATAPESAGMDARIGAIGMALRLDTPAGVAAWQEHVKSNRSQAALVRAGLQLLASAQLGVPAPAFDLLRNGSPALEAMADAGSALAGGKDPASALIALLDVGHPASAEWALVRTTALPADQAARVWRHLAAGMDDADPDKRPGPVLVTGLARELMPTDPGEVRELLERSRDRPEMQIAAMMGISESRSPDAAAIARASRGTMPRAAEGLAVLVIARSGGTLDAADLDVLGRAAAGGGDLDPVRALQAAWFHARARGTLDRVIADVQAAPSRGEVPPQVTQ